MHLNYIVLAGRGARRPGGIIKIEKNEQPFCDIFSKLLWERGRSIKTSRRVSDIFGDVLGRSLSKTTLRGLTQALGFKPPAKRKDLVISQRNKAALLKMTAETEIV